MDRIMRGGRDGRKKRRGNKRRMRRIGVDAMPTRREEHKTDDKKSGKKLTTK